MSDIKKVMFFLALFSSVFSSAAGAESADKTVAPQQRALPVATWLAYALLAAGGAGYAGTELKLHLDAKKNAGVKVLKEEETPALAQRKKWLRLQQIFQWLFIGGAAVGAGVLAHNVYKEGAPVLAEAKQNRDEYVRREANKAIADYESKAEERKKAAIRNERIEALGGGDYLNPDSAKKFAAMSATEQLAELDCLIEAHKKYPSIANLVARKIVEFALVTKATKLSAKRDFLAQQLTILFHADQSKNPADKQLMTRVGQWVGMYIKRDVPLSNWEQKLNSELFYPVAS